MKKFIVTTALLTAFVGSATGVVAFAAEDGYNAWMGGSVSPVHTADGVWQSNAMLSSSSVYYMAEEDRGEENQFLRLANFDGIADSEQTAVNFSLSAQSESGALAIAFSYRFVEGKTRYADEDPVLTFSAGGSAMTLTFADLQLSAQGNRGWNEKTVSVSPSVTADRLTVTYHFERGATYQNDLCYFDIDDVAVTSGGVSLFENGSFEFATVDKTTLVESFLYQTGEGQAEYLLGAEDMIDYGVNTVYSQTEKTTFSGGKTAAPLAASGSNGTYRGATSVKAGESDCFAVYNETEDNTFLRMGNFNAKEGVNATRFVMYFYNSLTGQQENMPATPQIVFSFDYRLYLDDVEAIKRSGSDAVFYMDTRSSSANNSGYVELADLTVNEQGDDTWHTYTGILETRRTTTEYFSFQFFGEEKASFETATYVDIDNFSVKTQTGDLNYAHLAGTFEGMAVSTSTVDPLNGQVSNDATLGIAGEKVAIDGQNYGLQLQPTASASILLNWTPTTNVYHVSFFTNGTGEFELYFSGRSGERIRFEIARTGEQTVDGTQISVTECGEGFLCNLYFARRAPERMQSLDFVNVGTTACILDDIFIGEVQSVCATAGDYEEYFTSLSELKAEYEREKNNYTAATDKQIRLALYDASLITEYSSAERMTACVNALSALLENGAKKADMTKLNGAIELAETILREGSKEEYLPSGWIAFRNALKKAYAVTDETVQSEVDAIEYELRSCVSNLQKFPEEENNGLAIALGVSGGALGLGGIALGAFLVQRRKKA
ncbi:MAG: hypothetical protein J6C93_06265 [Clostridia bacterium]|nr:hypothetical protein [Clostridia bacterium]